MTCAISGCRELYYMYCYMLALRCSHTQWNYGKALANLSLQCGRYTTEPPILMHLVLLLSRLLKEIKQWMSTKF